MPDHQEVYLDTNGYSGVIFEILEYVQKPTDEEALQYHFADLVADTGDSTNMLEQAKATMAKTPYVPSDFHIIVALVAPFSPCGGRRVSHVKSFTPWHLSGDTASALNFHVTSQSNTDRRNHPTYTLSFIQTPPEPANPNRKTPEFVSIHLLLLRLKEKGTDILITVNSPHYAGEYAKVEASEKTQLMKDGDAMTKRILESFEIRDWGLFTP